MPLVSVFTPTIRGLRALQSIERGLREQTFQDFEWLVEIGDGKTHELNAAYNRMLRRARGELVVFMEDWLWPHREGIEVFVNAYKGLIEGVLGNMFYTAPVPKTKEFWEGPDRILHYKTPLELEWRGTRGTAEIDWPYWEIDWGAAPLWPMKIIGGFDEYLDSGWGNGNSNLAFRASVRGAKIYNLGNIPSVGLKHDSLWAHPFRANYDPDFAERRRLQFADGSVSLPPLC